MAESFHSKLSKLAERAHLNTYALIAVLQVIQQETEVEIARLKNGEQPRLPPLKYRQLDSKI